MKRCDRIKRQAAAPEAPFTCTRCGKKVPAEAPGTEHRNHCPWCLWSVHLDVQAGDRAAGCGGDLEPIAVWARRNGEWAVVYSCRECGAVRAGRIAGDDNELALMSLAVRPLAKPPFPLDSLKLAADCGSQ